MAERLFGKAVAPQVPNAPRLRPQPIQSSTMVQAPRRQAGQNAMRMADAFGGLNQALTRYGAVAAAERDKKDDPNSEENLAFRDSLQVESAEEVRRMLIDNPDMSDVHKRYAGTILGTATARQAALQWEEYARTKLPEGANMAEEIDAFRDRMAAGMPTTTAGASFMRSTEEWADRMKRGFMGERVEQSNENMLNAAGEAMKMNADEALIAGNKPTEVVQKLFEANRNNKDFLKMSGAERNATLWNVANYYADLGKKDMVKQILKTARSDGSKLEDAADYMARSIDLMNHADSVYNTEWATQNFGIHNDVEEQVLLGEFSRADGDALLAQYPDGQVPPSYVVSKIAQSARVREGNITRLDAREREATNERIAIRSKQDVVLKASAAMDNVRGASTLSPAKYKDKYGNDVIMSVEKQKEAALAHKETLWDAQAAQMREEGQEENQVAAFMFAAKLKYASSNGVVIPQWSQQFKNLAVSITQVQLEAGDVPKEFQATMEFYRAIHGRNPAYAQLLVTDEKTQVMLDTYVRQVEHNGSGRDNKDGHINEALTAVRVANRTPAEQATSGLNQPDAAAAFEQANTTGGWFNTASNRWGSAVDDSPLNEARVLQALRSISQRNPHLSPEALYEEAAKYVVKTSQPVNGILVKATSANLGTDFSDIAEQILEQYATENTEDDIESGSELTLRESGTPGRYLVVTQDGRVAEGLADINVMNLNKQRQANADYAEREAATWLMSKEDMGHIETEFVFEPRGKNNVGALIGARFKKLFGAGRKVEDITNKQAKAFMGNHRRHKQIDAFVMAKADRLGMELIKYKGEPAWIDHATGNLQKLVVNWSDAGTNNSATWEDLGENVGKMKRVTYRNSIWRNRGFTANWIGNGRNPNQKAPSVSGTIKYGPLGGAAGASR